MSSAMDNEGNAISIAEAWENLMIAVAVQFT